MTELAPLLDLADLAVARCERVVPAETRRDLARVVRRARRKLGYVGEVLVVAFAGGTGTGKSSLINAILGESSVQTGVIRPTTNEALAVVPQRSMASYNRLLSDLDVAERIESSSLQSTIIVDLPDFDSTAEAHRHIVESVLPAVDAVVWVFDPEKYADGVVHAEFLAKLVPYERQFVFVLNQVDRLGDSVAEVSDDLKLLLESDGFGEPEVVSTIAQGPDLSVSELTDSLSERMDTKRSVISKLATDLRVTANEGWMAACASLPEDADASLRDERGLLAATFVLLGVEAIEVLTRTEEN
jgi:predicted GTPase